MMIAITACTEGLEIKPRAYLGDRFSAFRDAVAAGGGRWDRATKRNMAPLDRLPHVVAALRARDFEIDIDATLRTVAETRAEAERVADADLVARAGRVFSDLHASGITPYPYQASGIRWLATQPSALLGDEMGLGKTGQALAALRVRDASAPLLVICPAVAKGVWAAEISRWAPRPVHVCSGRDGFRWPAPGEAVVVNYDILPDEPRVPHAGTIVVADEAHAAKNDGAIRTRRLRPILQGARDAGGAAWLLTGTPLLNRAEELWNVLELGGLGTAEFGSRSSFMHAAGAYLEDIHVRPYRAKDGTVRRTRKIWKFSGRVSDTVPERLRNVMLARRRTDVLQDLPDLTWQTMTVETEMDQQPCDLTDILGHDIDNLCASDLRRLPRFEEIAAVRAQLAEAKIPAMLAAVAEYEEAGEPLVVFSRHLAPVHALGERAGWRTITGETSDEERTEIVRAFQAGELRGVGGTIQAMGVAITLTHASHMLFVDRDWTPALNDQAAARCMRIGQRRAVLARVLVARHPLDQRIEELLGQKQTLIRATVGAAQQPEPAVHRFSDVIQVAAPAPQTPVAPRAARSTPQSKRRAPETPTEEWARRALLALTENDPDRAQQKNGVGFNRTDNEFGHSLAQQAAGAGLTAKQWAAAARLCKKYHRQVGRPPEKD